MAKRQDGRGDQDRKESKKIEQLQEFVRVNEGKELTASEGVKISDDENTLSAGERGPQLLEDLC